MASSALEALVDCAEAIEAGDLRLADSRLDRVLTLADEQTHEYEKRVVKYFAEALVRRAYGLQPPAAAAAHFSFEFSPPLLWVYRWRWQWRGVLKSMGDGIQKEVMGKKRFHLIDFYIPHLYGGGDYLLFRALPKSCNNYNGRGRVSVRVSVVLPPCLKEIVNVERENKYLTEEAKGLGLEMEEELRVVYANSLSEVDLDLRRREDEDEGVVVLYWHKLQRMLGELELEREFMKLRRDINPDVVFILEQSADLNHPDSDYIKRLQNSFQYYSLALGEFEHRPVIKNYYRRQIGNIVGCQDSDRFVRPQSLHQWISLLEDAHFSQLPLCLKHRGDVKESNGCLVITSKNENDPRPLEFVSAWKLRDLGPITFTYNLSNPTPTGSNQIPPIPSQIYPLPPQDLSLNRLASLIEIYDMEEYICHKYGPSSTLTWVYKSNAKRIHDKTVSDPEHVLSIVHDYSYESGNWFQSVKEELLSKEYLSEKQYIIEKALQSKMLFHVEPRSLKFPFHTIVTICLQNRFSDDVYAVDFFCYEYQRTLKELDSLASDIFNYLKNVMKKCVMLRIYGSEDGFQEPISNIQQQIEPRVGRDMLQTRERNQQVDPLLPPMDMHASSIPGTSGVMETVGPPEQGCVKRHFEPPMSNSNEEVKDKGNSQTTSGKRRRLRSDVWEHFDKKKDERAICKYCHKGFDGSSKNGTTHLKNHFQRCKKVPTNVRDAQMIIPVERIKSVGEGNSSFDQHRSNSDVARMIIKYQSLEPLTSDILRVYNEEKLKLLKHFDQLSCRFNLTINLWIHKVEKITYCCYVVLFIDDNWELKKKVVALKRLGHEFDPKIVHESFKGVLEDWNFDTKVCSLTIHGSSSSFEVVEEIIKTWLSYETSHPLGSFYISGDECMNDFLSGDFNMLQNVGKSTDGVAGTSNPCLVGIHDMYYKGLGQNGKKEYPLMDVKTDNHNLRTLSLVLAIQKIFDPRFKYKFVEFSYESIYGKKVAKIHLRIIDDVLTDIFNEYVSGMNGDVNSSTLLNGEENSIESFHRWCDSKEKVNIEASFKSEELHNYLQEPIVKAIEFNLLGWWSEQASSFTTLGRMARDILAIPVSSIISGSILSEKAMMDNPIFNGLDPKIIEAMICSRDWLESPKDCCPIVKSDNISSVKEASMNTDLGKETIIWTEEEVRAYLVFPFTMIESERLNKWQNDAMIGECVGEDNIKGQSLAPLLMIPPSPCDGELRYPQNYYINDEVVNQFFILLKRRYERFPHRYLKHHSFDSAIATLLINGSKAESQMLKGLDKEDLKDVVKLFLPMCLREHWILFYADVDGKRLVWLDSLEQTRMPNDSEKNTIERWFLEFVLPLLGHDPKNWPIVIQNNIPSQKNSVDCGLFVMKYADCLTHGNYLPFTQVDMPHFRLRTLLDLYHGSTCLGLGQSYLPLPTN